MNPDTPIDPESSTLSSPAAEVIEEVHKQVAGRVDDLRKIERSRHFDLDTRGLLAVMALVGAFSLAFFQLALKGTADIPAWAAAVVTGVAGFYFGSRSGTNGRDG